MTPCPDETAILAFGRGEGEPSARRSVEYHVQECDECRSLVSAVVRSSSILPRAKPIDVMAMAPTTPVHGSGEASESVAVSPVAPGDVLAGKYVVERVLGAGGMGVVVAARHLQLGQRFAIKFLLPAACEMPDAVARFLREGKAAAQITSEHVARVVDTGVLDNGSPYLVMEYLEGSDLADSALLPLSPEEAVDYVLQACEAIVEAHELGIVHRDLKPANLFLTHRKDGSPLVKVLDFGISKASSGSSPALTSTSMMMGSPRYMSPEQMISAKDVDARSDVWALGVILFELVSGQPVWHADTIQGLCAMIATAPTPSLRKIVPSAPDLLDDIIARCLAKSPDQRVHSVADLALLLAPLASATAQTSVDRILRVAGLSRSLPIPRAPAVVGGTHAVAIVSQPPTSIRAPSPSTNGRVVILLGAAILLVAAAAAALLVLRKDPPAPDTRFPPAPTLSDTAPLIASAVAVGVAPSASASAGAPATSVSARPKLRHRPSAAPAGDKIEKPPAPAPAPGPDPAMSDRK